MRARWLAPVAVAAIVVGGVSCTSGTAGRGQSGISATEVTSAPTGGTSDPITDSPSDTAGGTATDSVGASDSTSGSASASDAPSSTATTTTAPASHSGTPTRSVTATRTASATPTVTATSSPPTDPAPDRVSQLLQHMSLAAKVGQLLMVDCPSSGMSTATENAIRTYHVGSVILDGNSDAGVQGTLAVTDGVRSVAPARTGLLIATDQEGGLVQRLQGPGFDRIPSAVDQGRLSPATLQGDARRWGRQLAAAGVNLNLAPVMDTVPPNFGSNPPIGDLDREYGHFPVKVARHGVSVITGMRQAGVATTAKHFPGLGRVRGNTDTTSGVRDFVTTWNDPYLNPFRSAVGAHVPFMMMSTAIYTHLDSTQQAAFSPRIVTGLLRQNLGFTGVVISDDLGGAAQVSDVPVGQRAVRFVRAGGDMVLTVDANQAAAMTSALITRAQRLPSFMNLVWASARRVLEAKQRLGLLG